METILTSRRRTRVLTVGLAAVISLYVLMVFVAEPLRTLAAVDYTTVTLQVTSAIALSCTHDVTLPSVPGSGTSGSGTTVLGYCTPITSDALGYTLGWRVVTGSGAPALGCSSANPCYGTGHMLSNHLTGGYPDAILAFARNGNKVGVPGDFDGDTIKTGSGSRWAARLMATSTTPGGGDITWGADGAHEGFLNVGTGSIVNIAKRTTQTSPTGDIEVIKYKVYIPIGVFQPSGTYKVTVQFTATDN
jgi:hypothetical protein